MDPASWAIDAPTSSTHQIPLYGAGSPSPPSSPGEDDASSSTTIAPKPPSSGKPDSRRPPSAPPQLGREFAHQQSKTTPAGPWERVTVTRGGHQGPITWYTPSYNVPYEPPPGAHEQPLPPSAQAEFHAHALSLALARESRRWYIPGIPEPHAMGGRPPQLTTQNRDPAYVPMPPGPTIVQPPSLDELVAILGEHRMAQLATMNQQRELMRYMRGLNDWLARDVQGQQTESRAVIARIDQLRDHLTHMDIGTAPAESISWSQAAGAGSSVVPPFGAGTPAGAGVPTFYPPGFIPQPPIIPGIQQSPHTDSPIIPETPDFSQPDSGMRPVRLAEMPYEEYIPSGISFITIMHALAVITAVVLALAAFCHTQPIQVRCQYDFNNALDSSAPIIGSAQNRGTAEVASHHFDGSSVGIQGGLADVAKSAVTFVDGPIISHAVSGDEATLFAGSQSPTNASKTSAAKTTPVFTALATLVGGAMMGAWLTWCCNKRQSR